MAGPATQLLVALLLAAGATGQDVAVEEVPSVHTTEDQHLLLKACKLQCATAGFCCGRTGGCGRPSCVLGCEIAHGSPSLETCTGVCSKSTDCRAGAPSSPVNASGCGSCQVGADSGGSCKGMCEPNGGCEYGCQAFFQARLPTGQPPENPQAGCFESIDYRPTDMPGKSRTVQPSTFACQALCASTPGCAHFTWYADQGCHLKDETAVRIAGSAGALSGPTACKVSCAEEGIVYEPLDMPGQNQTTGVHWAADCQARCAGTLGCAHFAWLPDGRCHLQDAAATKMYVAATLVGVVAGPPVCEAGCHETDIRYEPLDMQDQAPSMESSARLCQARCNNTEGCTHFSYSPSGRCHLQDVYAKTRAFVVGYTSGPRSCKAPGGCLVQGQYYSPMGTPRGHTTDWRHCQYLCGADSACSHFSYWPDGQCFFIVLEESDGGVTHELAKASQDCSELLLAPAGPCNGSGVVSGPQGCGPRFYDQYPGSDGVSPSTVHVAPAASTVQELPSPPTVASPPPPPVSSHKGETIHLELDMQGIDYQVLVADPALKSQFEAAVKAAVVAAAAASPRVSVAVVPASGSVAAQVSIVPSAASFDAVLSKIKSSQGALAVNVTKQVDRLLNVTATCTARVSTKAQESALASKPTEQVLAEQEDDAGCFVIGYYYVSKVKLEVASASWPACQKLCSTTIGCQHFSYWPDNNCVEHFESEGDEIYLFNSTEHCNQKTGVGSPGHRGCGGDLVVAGAKACGPSFTSLYPDLTKVVNPGPNGTLPAPPPPSGQGAPAAFHAGEDVEALSSNGTWLQAKVVGANADGSYTLSWGNGVQDAMRRPEAIRSKAGRTEAAPPAFRPGDTVEGRSADGSWLPARVAGANADGSYTLVWADGLARESAKRPEEVRAKATAGRLVSFGVGDAVEGLLANGTWLPARVDEVNQNGTYTLVWDSGLTQQVVKRLEEVRKKGAFDVGEAVQARREGGRWRAATVSSVNSDGSYTVDWASGSTRPSVEAAADIRTKAADEESTAASTKASKSNAWVWVLTWTIIGLLVAASWVAVYFASKLEFPDGDQPGRGADNALPPQSEQKMTRGVQLDAYQRIEDRPPSPDRGEPEHATKAFTDVAQLTAIPSQATNKVVAAGNIVAGQPQVGSLALGAGMLGFQFWTPSLPPAPASKTWSLQPALLEVGPGHGAQSQPASAASLFDTLDQNHDGVISRQEFDTGWQAMHYTYPQYPVHVPQGVQFISAWRPQVWRSTTPRYMPLQQTDAPL